MYQEIAIIILTSSLHLKLKILNILNTGKIFFILFKKIRFTKQLKENFTTKLSKDKILENSLSYLNKKYQGTKTV